MKDREEEAWLDSLLQRQGLPGLPEGDFQERVLRRLPPRERRGRRVLVLGLSALVALGALLLPGALGSGVTASAHTSGLLVPCGLGMALLWYVVDLLT